MQWLHETWYQNLKNVSHIFFAFRIWFILDFDIWMLVTWFHTYQLNVLINNECYLLTLCFIYIAYDNFERKICLEFLSLVHCFFRWDRTMFKNDLRHFINIRTKDACHPNVLRAIQWVDDDIFSRHLWGILLH